jgi:carboxyl-terminal processing protease
MEAMRKVHLAVLAIVAAGVAGGAQLTAEQRRLNLDSFDVVWTKIRDRHWDPQLGGLDWSAVRAEFRPRVGHAATMDDARRAMSAMLGRLNQSHFAIIPGDAYSEMGDQTTPEYEGSVGIDVRVIKGDQAVVVSVAPGSAADRAGVKPGWALLSAQDRAVEALVARVRKAGPHLEDLTLRRAVLALVSAPVGAPVKTEFLDGGGRKTALSLAAGVPRGRLSKFGNLPPLYVWAESRKIDRGGARTGYLAFNMFLDPVNVMGTLNTLMESCLKQCDGVVIDLRGNPGGLGVMSMGMAGWFVAGDNIVLGTMHLRDNTLKFAVTPRVEAFGGPLAILVDGGSASTSEIFAGGLHDLGRARIFGERTAGAALPSMIEKLPNGDAFQFAVANYISEGGRPLEGTGLTPDVETPVRRAALLAGEDPALDAALDWIGSEKARAARAGRSAAIQ